MRKRLCCSSEESKLQISRKVLQELLKMQSADGKINEVERLKFLFKVGLERSALIQFSI